MHTTLLTRGKELGRLRSLFLNVDTFQVSCWAVQFIVSLNYVTVPVRREYALPKAERSMLSMIRHNEIYRIVSSCCETMNWSTLTTNMRHETLEA